MAFISTYSRIMNRTLARQGQVVFQRQEGDYVEFLDAALASLKIVYPKFYKMDPLSRSGFLGTEILLQGQDLLTAYAPRQVAVVLSNAQGSLDTDRRYFETTKTIASPALFVYTLSNIATGEICIRHGLKGENAFFVSEQFDPEQQCEYIRAVMATDHTQACIGGWVDVLGDQHDVFLYLVEKQKRGSMLDFTAEQLEKLYRVNYGTVDGRP